MAKPNNIELIMVINYPGSLLLHIIIYQIIITFIHILFKQINTYKLNQQPINKFINIIIIKTNNKLKHTYSKVNFSFNFNPNFNFKFFFFSFFNFCQYLFVFSFQCRIFPLIFILLNICVVMYGIIEMISNLILYFHKIKQFLLFFFFLLFMISNQLSILINFFFCIFLYTKLIKFMFIRFPVISYHISNNINLIHHHYLTIYPLINLHNSMYILGLKHLCSQF